MSQIFTQFATRFFKPGIHQMEKLEITNQLKNIYGDRINSNLVSIKYCQTNNRAEVELLFNNIKKPVRIDLEFIGDDNYEGMYFKPENDIVDNAALFIEMDAYSLINCIDDLFNEKDAKEIEAEHQKSLMKK